jgi:hypothetical protein
MQSMRKAQAGEGAVFSSDGLAILHTNSVTVYKMAVGGEVIRDRKAKPCSADFSTQVSKAQVIGRSA